MELPRIAAALMDFDTNPRIELREGYSRRQRLARADSIGVRVPERLRTLIRTSGEVGDYVYSADLPKYRNLYRTGVLGPQDERGHVVDTWPPTRSWVPRGNS